MINSISGVLTKKKVNKAFVLTGGIEWLIHVSTITLDNLPPEGKEAEIYTYLHHREDIMQLFGFYNEGERALFLELLKVGGLGPRAVIKMLSGKKYSAIIMDLEQEDLSSLTSIPGVGKKTAQKIVLQLKGKLTADEDFLPAGSGGGSYGDIIQSLADMGFDKKAAEKTVNALARNMDQTGMSDEQRESELLRQAIISLSGS